MIHPDNPPPLNAKTVEQRRKTSLAMGGTGVVVTPEIAAAIYLDPRRQVDIAKTYGVTQTQVSRIKTGKQYPEMTVLLKEQTQSNGSDPIMINAVEKSLGSSRARVVCDICGHEEIVICDYERKTKPARWEPNHGQILRKINAKGWTEIKGVHRCPQCETDRKDESKKTMPQIIDPQPAKSTRQKGKLKLKFEATTPTKAAVQSSTAIPFDLATDAPPMAAPPLVGMFSASPLPEPEPEPKPEPMLDIQPEPEPNLEPAPVAPPLAQKPSRSQKREIIQLLEAVYDTALERYRGRENDASVASALDHVRPEWVAEIREDLFGPDNGNEEMQIVLDAIESLRADFQNQMDDLTEKAHAAEKLMLDAKSQFDAIRAAADILRTGFSSKMADLRHDLAALQNASA